MYKRQAEKWEKDPSLTVAEALSSQISIIGENMKIRRFQQMEEANGFVASYIHCLLYTSRAVLICIYGRR